MSVRGCITECREYLMLNLLKTVERSRPLKIVEHVRHWHVGINPFFSFRY